MSYIGVNLDDNSVIFKVPTMHMAALLSGTRYLDVTHMIFPVERRTAAQVKHRVRTLPKMLSPYEQKQLYKHLVGSDWTGTFGDLMDKLHEMLVELPNSDISMFDLEREAGPGELAADQAELVKRPVYQPVSMPVVEGNRPSAPNIPSAPAAAAPDAPWLRPAPSIPSAPTSIPSAPPSIPSPPKASALPSAPKAGSTTGRVWAIAEQTLADVPTPVSDWKEFKRVVVEECEAQGINPGTAGTQFGAWKRSKGL